MDFPCKTENLNLTLLPSWFPSPCQCDWINILTSLCSMYVVLLFIGYLRWTQHKGHLPDKRIFRGHNFRSLLSVFLFVVHLLEFSDPFLSYSPFHVLTVPSASVIFLVPVLILEHLLEKSSRPEFLIITGILWLANGLTRGLRFIIYYHLGFGLECLRPLTALLAFTICVVIGGSELIIINKELKQENAEDRTAFTVCSYRHDEAHFLSKATFYWMTSFLRVGYNNPLELDDLGVLPQNHTVKHHFKNLNTILTSNVMQQSPKQLWKVYWKFMQKDFLIGGFFKLMGDMVGLIGPLGISVIVDFVADKSDRKKNVHSTIFDFWNNGWSMGMIVFVAAIAQSTFSQASTHIVNVKAIHLKAALQALIYSKSLRLSNYSKYSTKTNQEGKQGPKNLEDDTGSIANLMSEDAFNVMSFFWIGHYVWAIPLKISMLMYLLYLKLGISAIIGAVVTILTLTPLQFLIGKKMSKNATFISELSDERLQHINALIQGIKLFKILAWEEYFCQNILNIRRKETKLLDKDSFYWAIMTFFTHASSILVTLITFGIYYLLGNGNLTPESVFSALAFFNQLTVPLFIFPVTVPIIIAAVVSTRRISEFLTHSETIPTLPRKDRSSTGVQNEVNDEKLTETEAASPAENELQGLITWRKFQPSIFYDLNVSQDLENVMELDENKGIDQIQEEDENVPESSDNDIAPLKDASNLVDVVPDDSVVLKIENGVFAWNSDKDGTYLNINCISVPKGKITLVVGKVGSGKTSFLSAVLGEMHRISGVITWRRNTSVAYCAQTPWLLNATVRDNILFGQPFKPRRYSQVLNACALQPDLDILPMKDLTEIGERGINLSGGQKQRIAIARALYSKANFVILDDPLSSLDSNVAMEVFEGGIKRLTRRGKRTVLLVTHHLQLLAHCQMIIAMENGSVRIHGQLNDIESNDRELMENWRDLMSKNDCNSFQNRTARERWQLVKLVARIGRELRQKNIIDGLWSIEEENQIPSVMYHYRRRCTFSGWKYMSHDLPLPTDECERDVIEGRSSWRKTTKKRTMLRATSLQARHVRVPPVVRQHSSPLTCSDAHLSLHKNGPQTSMLKNLFSDTLGSKQSAEPIEERSKKPLGRLLSTESGFSDAASEIDADEWEEMECQLGNKGTEEKDYGQIPKRVYLIYIRACGTGISLLYLVLTLAWQTVRVNTDFWLSTWTEASGDQEMSKYIVVYGVLSLGSIVLSLASHGLGQYAGSRGRIILHDSMLLNIVKCPMKLFESTPAGRMFNRFSTDMSVIDKKIATSIQRLMQFLMLCCSAIIINTAVTPWFLIVAVPVCLLYYSIQKFYRSSSRKLERLDSISKSPIFSHFAETLSGLSTIRAFGYQEKFTLNLYTKLDLNTNSFLIMNSGNRWLGIVLDYLGGVIVFLAILISLATSSIYPELVTPSLVGLAINYTLLVPIYLNWVVKFLADCEMYMGAVERVHQYAHLLTEDYFPEPGTKVPNDWPRLGDVKFQNISLRYGAGKEPVITSMNLSIPSGQKVGICGRTGSGKSSLALSLFNMIEIYDGQILVDGVDITTIPLQTLRSRISIIPQDVLLFNGSVRENLDPTKSFADEELWQTLDKAQLKEVFEAQRLDLDYEMKGGQTLSSGQKQLFCLARAILHKSSILIMDEATSNLDRESEQILMSTAKKLFSGKTLIIIAHRLSTILDCDRIVVLEKGKIVEEGPPNCLLQKNLGLFSTMLRSSEEGLL